MSPRIEQIRKKALRAVTWSCVLAVPALVAALVAPGLSTALAANGTVAAPSGLLVPETRAFGVQGNRLTDPAALMGNELPGVWQNTYRPPAPPPYRPPSPSF